VDQLNMHAIGSLYKAFPPAEAERLEIHHTHKHGSWLSMTETEFSPLARQCLDGGRSGQSLGCADLVRLSR
jgi:hypothetical protein